MKFKFDLILIILFLACNIHTYSLTPEIIRTAPFNKKEDFGMYLC